MCFHVAVSDRTGASRIQRVGSLPVIDVVGRHLHAAGSLAASNDAFL
jgi:hypothetical protein